MKRADIKIWFACNNHCKFCVQWDKRLQYKQRTLEEIKKIIKEEYDNWCRWVVFTGWEPTIHEWLVDAIKFARTIWYQIIQIQSNWRTFKNMDYLKSLIAAWVTEFWPSIHWFYQETHDYLVQSPWAWQEVIEWIKNLRLLWQNIIINSVITKRNYEEIPKLATLLVKLWVSQFQFAFVHILWSADKNKLEIVPKKSLAMPYIKKWLDIGKANWVICMVEAIPFCLMQWYEWAIAEYNYMPDTTVVDAEYRTEEYADYRWNVGKAKREECKTCSKFKICEWPWKEYPEIFWWEEFKPIYAEQDV